MNLYETLGVEWYDGFQKGPSNLERLRNKP